MSGRGVAAVAGVVVAGLGALLGVSYAVAPEQVERVYGDVKVAVQQSFMEVTHSTPVIRLGIKGGQRELDWCDGSWIELTSYQVEGVPPVFAAHNNCGGDIILNWPIGQAVKIQGRSGLYQVVSERYTSKSARVSELVGMTGEVVLQSCYYGRDRMRFVGLVPIENDAPAVS